MVTKEQIEEIKFKLKIAVEYNRIHKNKDLDLTTLAAAIGVSYGILSDFIKSEYGISFRSYLNDIRIRKALEEIARFGDSLKVNDYARLVGFRSRSTFFNAFKKRIGMSVSQYVLEYTQDGDKPIIFFVRS